MRLLADLLLQDPRHADLAGPSTPMEVYLRLMFFKFRYRLGYEVRDRSRSAGRRAGEIGAKLRLRGAQTRDEAQAVVRRVTGTIYRTR